MIEEKEPEKYDVEEYKTLLDAGFRSALKKSLNEVEPVMEDTVQHVGKLVDGRIKRVQNQLQVCGITFVFTLFLEHACVKALWLAR